VKNIILVLAGIRNPAFKTVVIFYPASTLQQLT